MDNFFLIITDEFYFRYFIEQRTRGSQAAPPDIPRFEWSRLPSDNGYANIKVTWLPNIDGKPGSHFFVKYK